MQKLIVANWKMNGTVQDAIKWIADLQKRLDSVLSVEVAVAPPFTALYSAQVILQETQFKLAAQDMHWETSGAFTGEISPLFLQEAGCQYVILGHSERRRYFGETDETVNKKIMTTVTMDLAPIFCIGETELERQEGETGLILENQIRKGLKGLHLHDLAGLVIAYEPMWAIGTGLTATPSQIEETHSYIRNFLEKMYDAPTARGIRILYGGSVNENNAGVILKIKNVDGLLVGGASLDAQKFAKIVKSGYI